jgi:hypothetical protein
MARRSEHSCDFAFVFGLVALAALVSPARAEDYPACAKIENPLAYNECLAAHGPPAHATRAIAPPEGGDGPRGGWAAHGHAPRAEVQFSRARNGRMVMEFTVGGPPAASHKRKETQ